MPWQNQGGGSNQGPWGNRSTPPDIEDLIRQGQDRFRKMMPKGFGNGSGILAGLAIIFALWMLTGFYRVQEGEQAAVLRFGKWVETTSPGLRYHLPHPVEEAIVRKVSTFNRIDSTTMGFDLKSDLRGSLDPSLMLTGDENIAHVNFTVLWYIKDLGQYLFRAHSPDETVKTAAESVIREIIAQTPIEQALTSGKARISDRAQALLQGLVDEYEIGVQIHKVDLQRVDPPDAVIDSFLDVQRAKADQERLVNEAHKYENSIVPVAEGNAIKYIEAGEAYKAEKIERSKGDVGRFNQVLIEYRKAPEITKERIYLETVQSVLSKTPKVVLGKGSHGAQGVVPYLPLPEVQKRTQKEAKEAS